MRNHSNYILEGFMPVTALARDIKLVAVGNSRGVRLPRELLRKYGISDALVLEERSEGILLRGTSGAKVSLDQTFGEMAAAQENWSDLDGVAADGLATLKW
jgi:antitoxin MazE